MCYYFAAEVNENLKCLLIFLFLYFPNAVYCLDLTDQSAVFQL